MRRRHLDITFLFSLCCSLVINSGMVELVVLHSQPPVAMDVQRLKRRLAATKPAAAPAPPAAPMKTATRPAAPPVEEVALPPPPPPPPPKIEFDARDAFGENHGIGEALNSSPGERPMMSQVAPQIQAYLGRNPPKSSGGGGGAGGEGGAGGQPAQAMIGAASPEQAAAPRAPAPKPMAKPMPAAAAVAKALPMEHPPGVVKAEEAKKEVTAVSKPPAAEQPPVAKVEEPKKEVAVASQPPAGVEEPRGEEPSPPVAEEHKTQGEPVAATPAVKPAVKPPVTPPVKPPIKPPIEQPVKPPVEQPLKPVAAPSAPTQIAMNIPPPSLASPKPPQQTPMPAPPPPPMAPTPPPPTPQPVENPRPAPPEKVQPIKPVPPGKPGPPGPPGPKGPLGPPNSTADPAPASDKDSDPFSEQNSFHFVNGKVEARQGRAVRPVKPHFTEASMVDAAVIGHPRVTFLAKIDENGNVVRVSRFHSSGSDNIDLPCEEALNQWWIEPSKDKNGHPIKGGDVVSITFELY